VFASPHVAWPPPDARFDYTTADPKTLAVTTFCTIVDQDGLAHARVLARSLARHNGGARLTALVVDHGRTGVRFSDEPFDRLDSDELELAGLEELVAGRDRDQVRSTLQPSLLLFLIQGDRRAIFLDPEARVFAELGQFEELATRHSMVLVPCVLAPIPLDGRSPTEPDLQALGIYNSGCLAVGPGAEPLLEWHAQHLRQGSVADPRNGSWLDRRWIDFAPSYVDHAMLDDPGYGVANWNLHERRLSYEEGRYVVGELPLRIFQFRGFDPGRPDLITRDRYRSGLRPRARLSEDALAQQLCAAYAQELLADAGVRS
jgi:hypothetical protein